MSVAAIVVAAGEGSRFGGRKQFAALSGRPVAARAVEAARSVASFVVLVVPNDALGEAHGADVVVAGGATRSASVRAGLAALDPTFREVVVHDAARPLASPALFRAVLDALDGASGVMAAVPGLAITDTVKRLEGTYVAGTLPRDGLVTVQTPQAFVTETLRAAHEHGDEATDDAALVEAVGGRVVVVAGEVQNRKLTTADDLSTAAAMLERHGTVRIGQGLDVHRFSEDASRVLVLGGVVVPGGRGLQGHSDADVATHALCDAVLGAAGLGDLGRHFPDDDPSFAGIASTALLARCGELARAEGLVVANADVTIVAESPRLGALLGEMARCLSGVVGAPVSVKATTSEGLGALGRNEGIAASAVALLERVSGS